jgi:7-cyano-7-deazaguanine reductase
MGEQYGLEVQTSGYAWSKKAMKLLEKIYIPKRLEGKNCFRAGEFKTCVNAIRQEQDPDWKPDKKRSMASDILGTLARPRLHAVERIKRGYYRFVKWPKDGAKIFNQEYPKYKNPHRNKEKKGKPFHSFLAPSVTDLQKKMENLTKLGSAKTQYKYAGPSIDILETFINKHQTQIYLVPFVMPRDEFSSLCPVTGQPDQASIEVLYVPNQKMVESKSLKLYFFSYRNHGAFHEDIVNSIANDLWALLKPKYLRVFGNFSPRGGVSIKPLVEKYEDDKRVWGTVTDIKISRLVNSWDRKNPL